MVLTKKALAGVLAVVAMSLFGASDAWAQACTTSVQCPDVKKPICDTLGTGQCRACATGVECGARNPNTTICSTTGSTTGSCIGCISNAQCQGVTPVCNVGNGTCLACLGSGDCTNSANPVCDQASNQCVSCAADFQPNNPQLFSCSNPDLPACQGANRDGGAPPPDGGARPGQCTQCRAPSGGDPGNPGVCPARPEAPICSTRAGSPGGQCGCNADANCGTKNGRICDGTRNSNNGECINGCRATADCPTGKTCETIVNGVGICKGQTCNPANGNADCKTAPNLVCDSTLNGGECVECANDNQCTGGKVCETDPNNPNRGKCVECTPIKDNNCTPTGPGNKCIGTTDTCGCITDDDCGDSKSGRVCDEASTHKCIEGCRGQGGNGCADDKSCSSTNRDIGKCNPKSGGDGGGADGGGNGDGGNNGNGNGLVSLDNFVEGGGCSCTTTGGGANPLLGLGIGLGLGLAAISRRLRRSKK